MLTAIVALRVGLTVLDRQLTLPNWAAEIWYHAGNVSDMQAFTVLYLVTPLIWLALSAWWWLTRAQVRWSRWVAAVLVIGVVFALPAWWAWFATALWQIERVFDIEGIPRDLIFFGFADTDYWGVAVVLGLSCMLCLVVVNLALAARTTRA